ncbi:hypothetical protein BGZ49_007816 [Haplosporangium sp. Z 27]|nr:hypothetical protein BGZ49_007816 [Haplosporangium sp. Z 27]
MSSLGHGTAAELAQKYKEKALARKRGAGTHQPKFRGFTLGKTTTSATTTTAPSNDKSVSAITENVDNIPVVDIPILATAKTAAKSKTLQVLESVEVQTPFSENLTTTPSSSSSGLNEKYQERFMARFRGSGSHQPGFKGFTLKPTTRSSERLDRRKSLEPTILPPNTSIEPIEQESSSSSRHTDKQSEKSTRNKTKKDTRESHNAKRVELTNALKALSITKDDSNTRGSEKLPPSSSRQHTKPISTTGKERSASSNLKAPTSGRYTDSTQPLDAATTTPGGKLTRSASRSSGYTPDFKITWGKNNTVLTTSSSASNRQSETRDKQLESHQRPVIEDTIDDTGFVDDFDPIEYIPSPTRDITGQEPDTIPRKSAAAREVNKSKRKPISTPAPDTMAQTSTRKNGHGVGKRRRLIQEEVDENEDPQPIHQNQVSSRSNINDGLKKSTLDYQENKDKRSEVQVNKDKKIKTKPAKSNQAVSNLENPTSRHDTSRPLRQTTLMHLASKPTRKDEATTRNPIISDDSGDESDFVINSTKKSKSSTSDKRSSSKKTGITGKGASEQTVKTYKQLQIHCLKFWGPFGAASRPATVTNRATAKQLPVEGEAPIQKTVQSVLEIDDTPLTEMDVIAEAVRDVVDNFM